MTSGRTIKTGYKQLDERTGGLRLGSVTIVGGDTGVGKTSFCVNLVKNLSIDKEICSVIFTSESNEDGILDKLLSCYLEIDSKNIKDRKLSESEWLKIIENAKSFANNNFDVFDNYNMRIEKIYSHADKANQRLRMGCECKKLKLIVIDCINTNIEDYNEANVENVHHKLKMLAKVLNVAVVVVAHLKQTEQHRFYKKTLISDLKISRHLQEDSDLILLLNEKNKDLLKNKDNRDIQLIVAKNAKGETGVIDMKFVPKFSKFVEQN